jgi:hypothetical protein
LRANWHNLIEQCEKNQSFETGKENGAKGWLANTKAMMALTTNQK